MPGRAHLNYHSAAAFVRDIEVSKKFYTEVLELAIEFDFGKNVIMEGGITLWQISHDHIITKHLGIDAIENRGVNRFEFYFETVDMETVYERLNDWGVEFLHPVHEEPWGQKTLRFFDPDRHLIEVGESMETFVKRLYKQAGSPEQVSQKTSIPLHTVRGILGL